MIVIRLNVVIISLALAASTVAAPIDIGSRLEPMVDDYLIESLSNATLTLHEPTQREVAVVHDQPWEGNSSCYHTVFRDGDVYRMYYRGTDYDNKAGKDKHATVVCYAESKDGIHWTKPALGLVEFNGSKQNSVVLLGRGAHCFAPFKDTNPACKPEQRYKALAWDWYPEGGPSSNTGLLAFQSTDGLRWQLLTEKPVVTKGEFDSQNLAFWDPTRQCYVAFQRGWKADNGRYLRDIVTYTSTDFQQWTDAVWLEYPGAAKEDLYTNQIAAYCRAPHILLGFPMRFLPARRLVEGAEDGVSDAVFMSSRDGVSFHRWGEAFIRPGLQMDRWVQRNNMTAWGIVQTKSDVPGTPDELSLYASEGYCGDMCRLRRYTIRLDGFVSVWSNSLGGEMVTKPLTFAGDALEINFSTSAAGSVRVEIQDASGKPIPGFTLDDCPEIFGDRIDHVVFWKQGNGVTKLAGQPIRLRFVMKDADLYAIRFR